MNNAWTSTGEPGRFTKQLPPTFAITAIGGGIYDTAPPGTWMPWKLGTELCPGWEWVADAKPVRSPVNPGHEHFGWIDLPEGEFGWARRTR